VDISSVFSSIPKISFPALDGFYRPLSTNTPIDFYLKEDQKGVKITPQVLIIPALGLDLSGFRLGRGGGYYDKYLGNFQGISIGVIFEDNIIDSFPREDHDSPVDFILTEKKAYSCKRFRS
jgi:5,10-methenyltetrahydrofolate synthetase